MIVQGIENEYLFAGSERWAREPDAAAKDALNRAPVRMWEHRQAEQYLPNSRMVAEVGNIFALPWKKLAAGPENSVAAAPPVTNTLPKLMPFLAVPLVHAQCEKHLDRLPPGQLLLE